MFFKTLSILNILNQHTPTPDDNDIYTAGVVNSVQGSVSDEYSSEKAYAVGDYCIYNNTLYKCIQAKAAGTDATPPNASYWTNKNSDNSALTVGSELSSLNGKLADIGTKTVIWNSGNLTSSSWTNDTTNNRYIITKSLTTAEANSLLNAFSSYKYGSIFHQVQLITTNDTYYAITPIYLNASDSHGPSLNSDLIFGYNTDIRIICQPTHQLFYYIMSGSDRSESVNLTWNIQLIGVK